MKQRKISKEEYIKLFCPDKRIRDRKVIYVGPDTYRKITQVSHVFQKLHVSTSSLVDTILSHHLSIHKEILDELIRKQSEEDSVLDPPSAKLNSMENEKEEKIENLPD